MDKWINRAKAIGITHLLYTQYINRMHCRSGHLWQNRFYSCPLDHRHFWEALRYIECNPVRAKLVRFAWDYQWSSAGPHTGARDRAELLNNKQWLDVSAGMQWKQILSQAQADEEINYIRVGTYRGRPLGNDSFVSKLERCLGHRIRPLPVGRPKRKIENVKLGTVPIK